MDVFAVSLLILVAAFLGAVLVGGLIAVIQSRNSRRERLQMKKHLHQIGTTGGAG
jgi:uncharacterized oligopeptide transporter (OPT) family protein